MSSRKLTISVARAIVIISLFLTGCYFNPIKTYDGEEKPLSEIALVKCDAGILVNSVDGNQKHKVYAGHGWEYHDCEIGLLPGPHSLGVCFLIYVGNFLRPVEISCDKDIPVQLDAQSGRIYRIRYERNNGGGRWKPWIDDVTESERMKIETEKRNK